MKQCKIFLDIKLYTVRPSTFLLELGTLVLSLSPPSLFSSPSSFFFILFSFPLLFLLLFFSDQLKQVSRANSAPRSFPGITE